MAESKDNILLAWTKIAPASEGQDPLGLQLRVTARLGADLLHCITSITPRARYYSLLPWIILYAQEHYPDKKLRETVRMIEKSFTTGCLLSHSGHACQGGGLIGSEVLAPWYNDGHSSDTWQSASFAVNPALDAYLTSLVNLHLFAGQSNNNVDNEEETTTAWDGIYELSDLGQQLVSCYKIAIENTIEIIDLNSGAAPKLDALKMWGEQGGLCELRRNAPDRQSLENLFFNRVALPEDAHMHRRDSLLLLLYLTQAFTKHEVQMNAVTLCTAVYYNSMRNLKGEIFSVIIPDGLKDSSCRWRMFYHHRYLSYALEYLFSNAVSEANRDCINGITIERWMEEWSSTLVTEKVGKMLQIDIKTSILDMTPRDILKASGVDIKAFDREGSITLEREVGFQHALSEHALYEALKPKSMLYTPESCILSTLMCALTIMRYQQWHIGEYGNWLSQATRNAPYENVTVPVISENWKALFGDFWNTRLRDLAQNLVHRYVIRLHLTLAYQKSGAHFYLDDDRIIGRDKHFGIPQLTNPRLNSALQILWDLGLLENDPHDETLSRTTELGKSSNLDGDELATVKDVSLFHLEISNNRRLHAKLVALDFENECIVLSGSCNFTTAAFDGINVEAALCIKEPVGFFDKFFPEDVTTIPIIPKNFIAGDRNEPNPPNNEHDVLRISGASLNEDGLIKFYCDIQVVGGLQALTFLLKVPGEKEPRRSVKLHSDSKGFMEIQLTKGELTELPRASLFCRLEGQVNGKIIKSPDAWIIQKHYLTRHHSESKSRTDYEKILRETGQGLTAYIDALGKREGLHAVIEFLQHLNIRFKGGLRMAPGTTPRPPVPRDPTISQTPPEWAPRYSEEFEIAVFEFVKRHHENVLHRHAQGGNLNGLENFIDVLSTCNKLMFIHCERGLIKPLHVMSWFLAGLYRLTGGGELLVQSKSVEGFISNALKALSGNVQRVRDAIKAFAVLEHAAFTLVAAQRLQMIHIRNDNDISKCLSSYAHYTIAFFNKLGLYPEKQQYKIVLQSYGINDTEEQNRWWNYLSVQKINVGRRQKRSSQN